MEKCYLEALKQRDMHEKKSYQHIYEDFGKYNQEIKRVMNKNNELTARLGSAVRGGSGPVNVKIDNEYG